MSDFDHESHHELIELAAEDALGLLSDKQRVKFEDAVASASPEVQEQVRATRDSVMNEVKNSLSDVKPEPSLKHRVMARIMQLIERDLGRTVQGTAWEQEPGSTVDRRDWMERLIAGRVAPFWRVAALVLATVSASLLFLFMEARVVNRELMQLARGNEVRDLFEKRVGPATLDFIMDYRTEHIVMAPVDETSEQRGLVSYYPTSGQGLFLAAGLNNRESQYRVYVNADGVDEVVVSFQASGEVVAIDFDLPSGINPLDSIWWVAEVDADGQSERIFESIS